MLLYKKVLDTTSKSMTCQAGLSKIQVSRKKAFLVIFPIRALDQGPHLYRPWQLHLEPTGLSASHASASSNRTLGENQRKAHSVPPLHIFHQCCPGDGRCSLPSNNHLPPLSSFIYIPGHQPQELFTVPSIGHLYNFPQLFLLPGIPIIIIVWFYFSSYLHILPSLSNWVAPIHLWLSLCFLSSEKTLPPCCHNSRPLDKVQCPLCTLSPPCIPQSLWLILVIYNNVFN